MSTYPYVAAVLLAAAALLPAPAAAIDGEVLITNAKALAGNVTPGDAAGYPVTVSRAGSYKLASNLEVSANKHGIVVSATEVTIDLNGFRMNGGKVALYGIVGSQRGLTVRNGTILFFKNDGIQMAGALLIVENMRIEENGLSGIREVGAFSGFARILNSTIFGNGRHGISCQQWCHIEGNNISRNGISGGFTGVILSSGTLLGNTIIANGGFGVNGNAFGFGNNTIFNNVAGQAFGGGIPLHPNACSPETC